MKDTLYFDNNATTPIAEEVLAALLPTLGENYGNSHSIHSVGRAAEAAVILAREQVADFLHCEPNAIRFNSGATEGIQQVARSVFEGLPKKRHFVTTEVEHGSVLAAMDHLKRYGAKLSYIGVDSQGRLDLEGLASAIRPDTALVSVMAANHETGVIFPLDVVARVVKEKGALLHVDATQAIGKLPFDLSMLEVDFLTFSGHKFHGPKGIGALVSQRGLGLKGLSRHLEGGLMRAGTDNVPGIVGLGAAAVRAAARWDDMEHVRQLRDHFEKKLLAARPKAQIHGAKTQRLPNTTFVSFPGELGEALLLSLDAQGICVSTGSACASATPGQSHVLQAMGVDPMVAQGTLRISMSTYTKEEEVDRLLEALFVLVP